MPYYRLYFLDRQDHIRHVVDMECADDTDAMRSVAAHKVDGRVMELWNQDRLVRRFDAAHGAGEIEAA